MSAADTLRLAADLIEQRGGAASACWSAHGTDDNDTAWLDLMSPHISAPLAAWLGDHADYCDAVSVSPEPYALALARAILGEPT